jgi:acylphosphatase
MDKRHQLHVVVHGRVQGVSFRYYTVLKAQNIGLVGWVRNLPDGTVEVTAEGERIQLEQLLEFLHHGPSGASVTSVDVKWLQPSGEITSFEVR